jgi:hypothetical protein
MFKFLSIVCLLFTSASALSFNLQPNDFSTKKIVRAKLWYEGVKIPSNLNLIESQAAVSLPEEISIPLELLDT